MLSLFASSLLVIHGPAATAHHVHSAGTAQVSTWKIDATHSELLFRIRHLVSKVTGTFTDWDGTIVADPADWKGGTALVNIRAASISTNNQRRDTATYPELTFKSTSVSVSADSITLNGDLTIGGTTRPVVLSGTFNGISPGADGRDRVGFEVSTRINQESRVTGSEFRVPSQIGEKANSELGTRNSSQHPGEA